MAVNGKIGRLCERIDALACRRWDNLTEENLTDEGRAKLDRLAASAALENSQADARRLHSLLTGAMKRSCASWLIGGC
jgi:hypothetical protein